MILLTLGAAYVSSSHQIRDSASASNPSDTLFTDRSTLNIVWSCLATIFACTWICVHPNIPSPKDGAARILGRRIAIMVYLLAAPEMVICWTMRQYLGASEISKRHEDKGWTKVHGFFLIMGGFCLHENGVFLRTLEALEMEKLAADGEIDWPTITEEEIQDKSKGDYFSKGFVILQTSWFVVQCIVRASKHMVLTELEIVTLAYSALIVAIYALWWYKPLDVGVAMPVYLKPAQVSEDYEDELNEQEGRSEDNEVQECSEMISRSGTSQHGIVEFDLDQQERLDVDVQDTNPTSQTDNPSNPSSINATTQTEDEALVDSHSHLNLVPDGTKSRVSLAGNPSEDSIPDNTPSWQEKSNSVSLRSYIHSEGGEHGPTTGLLHAFFVAPFLHFFGAFTDMLSCTTLKEKQYRVPTFYSPQIEDDSLTLVLSGLVVLVFGGIHCVAWSFSFPTEAERWVWRVSAVLLMATPFMISGIALLIDQTDEFSSDEDLSRRHVLKRIMAAIWWWCGYGSVVLYFVARLALLVLPVMSLRALPPGAYIDLDWTAYLPHM